MKAPWKVLAICCVLLTAGASAQEAAAKPAEGEKLSAADRAAIAADAAKFFVKVDIQLQYDKGEAPEVAGYAKRCPNCGQIHGFGSEEYIKEERPLTIAGILIAPDKAMLPDLQLHPRFIKSITAKAATGKEVTGKIDAWLAGKNAIVIAFAETLSAAALPAFNPQAEQPYLCASYAEGNGTWMVTVDALSGPVSVTELGKRFCAVDSNILVLDKKGAPVALPMTEELPVDGSWKTATPTEGAISAADMQTKMAALEKAASASLLRATLNFRSPKGDKNDGMGMGRFRSYRRFSRFNNNADDDNATERNTAAVLLDAQTLLVLANLPQQVTARLTKIRVFNANGEAVEAKFAATLKDWCGFLAKIDKPIEGAPTLSSADIRDLRGKLLLGAELRIQGDKRVLYLQPRRIASIETGWHGKAFPATGRNDNGDFLFNLDGKLVCLPLEIREKVVFKENGYSRTNVAALPSAFIKEILADTAKNSDPNNVPLSEKDEKRLAWLGVELQPLNKELARENKVSDLTQEGETGAMVSYVYPDSPAAKAGIEAGDILIRIQAEGQPKPLDVKLEDEGSAMNDFPWDDMDNMPEQAFAHMPAPWPAAENSFISALTEIGFGVKCKVEFSHKGEATAKDMVIERAPAHYDASPRYKSAKLGLTSRDLTYEVRRYFQLKPEDTGIIVSKVEQGGKAAVAGLRPYEIITHVNDQPVTSIEEMKKLIKGQAELRLNVKRMTKSRVVKITMGTDKPDAPEGDSGKTGAAQEN